MSPDQHSLTSTTPSSSSPSPSSLNSHNNQQLEFPKSSSYTPERSPQQQFATPEQSPQQLFLTPELLTPASTALNRNNPSLPFTTSTSPSSVLSHSYPENTTHLVPSSSTANYRHNERQATTPSVPPAPPFSRQDTKQVQTQRNKRNSNNPQQRQQQLAPRYREISSDLSPSNIIHGKRNRKP